MRVMSRFVVNERTRHSGEGDRFSARTSNDPETPPGAYAAEARYRVLTAVAGAAQGNAAIEKSWLAAGWWGITCCSVQEQRHGRRHNVRPYGSRNGKDARSRKAWCRQTSVPGEGGGGMSGSCARR